MFLPLFFGIILVFKEKGKIFHMNVFVSGVNYRKASLEIREKLSFTATEQGVVLKEIKKLHSVDECILLSTCNRTEVYIFSDSSSFNNEVVEMLLCKSKGLDIYEFKKYFYFYSSAKAVMHLFKVASGLDSMVLGEDQILGQVKSACETAMEAGTSGSILNGLFREAVTAAKKVKTYTGLSKNSLSVASLSVKLLTDFFGGILENKSALVIGTGNIGKLTLKNLISKGIGKIYVTNRTHGTAEDLSKGLPSVQSVEYNDRYSIINVCDIVISSTASPHYTITRDMLEKSLTCVRQRVFIDLAVPRDIDVSIKEMPAASYFNMDDLQMSVDRNIDNRLLEVSRAEEIIDRSI
ncbi:MAG: glutamyl-tRNA reductase, partial [Ruminiclostridium sp.]|nr:glutamyl-tRNA reductase [Ruminiclostridium sp.]